MNFKLFPGAVIQEICKNMDISTIGTLHTSLSHNLDEETVSVVSMIPDKHFDNSVNGCLLHYALKRGVSNHVSLHHIKQIYARYRGVIFETDSEGRSLLLCALLGKHDIKTIEYILKLTPTKMMSRCDSNGASALHYSLMNYRNDINLLIKLVSEDKQLLLVVDAQNRSLMHYATMLGCNRTILEFLCLVCSNHLTRQDNTRKIPLHYGLYLWKDERDSLTCFLLSKTEGTLYNRHGVGRQGNLLSCAEYHENASLLMCAASNRVSFKTLQELSGFDPLFVAMQDIHGRSVLYHMPQQDYDAELIIWFATSNLNCIYERHTNGVSLLHLAIRSKTDSKVLRVLCGPDGDVFYMTNNDGITPLQMLIRNETAE